MSLPSRMLATLTVALLATGCAKSPGAYQAAADAAAASSSADVSADLSAGEELFASRDDPAKLMEALDAYERVVAADPDHRQALTRLVRGWYFLGDVHTTDKQDKIDRWAKAIEYGKRCLALNGDFASRIAGGEKPKDAVASATAEDAPCLYWTATAIGKWGKIQGIAKTLGNLPTVKAYVSKVEELDPSYFHYGPARYWGAYYSVLPSFAGQDLELSAEYFKESLAGAPDYLGTRILRAENLAVKTQDVALFHSDIAHVLDFDVDTNPELRPENVMEQAKARALLEIRDELFDRKTLETYEASTSE